MLPSSYHGKRSRASSKDALCCCEYVKKDGELSHILACCCDCEALDTLCDRFLKCQGISPSRVDDLFRDIEDRLRIPRFNGEGAMRVKLDIALPIIVVPLGMAIATINFFFTILILITLPVAILGFYQLWLQRPMKNRTRIFYSWGLTSVLFMYYTFEFVVLGFREILLWENLLLSTLFGLTMFAFYHCKKGPGIVQRNTSQDFNQQQPHQTSVQDTYSKISQAMQEEQNREQDEAEKRLKDGESQMIKASKEEEEEQKKLGIIGNFLVDNFGMDKEELLKETEEEIEEKKGHVISAEMVTWVDSRTQDDGRVRTWCRWCRVNKPPRAGHCPLCNSCIPGRDHHCVWIDCCVGAGNHRSFFAAVILVLITGCYGVHLTLTTICTPVMYFDYFLFPNDCRFVYSDFPTALCFVSACYTAIGLAVMMLVFFTQCAMISQNVTTHEHHAAGLRKWTRWGVYVRNNVNNRGCVRNWLDFCLGRRKRNPKYVTMTV